MRIDLTSVSQEVFDDIAQADFSAAAALDYLSKDITVRPFSEILRTYAGGRDAKKVLTDAFCVFESHVKKESISRKVRDWLNDKYEPSDREDFFKICFAFSLNEIQMQNFLCLSTDSGIHYRNPKELAFAYGIRTGKTYGETRALYEALPEIKGTREETAMPYTNLMMNAFKTVYDDEGFFEFFYNNGDKLGTFHNTAYAKFNRFFNLLLSPERQFIENKEDKYSVEEAVNTYLRMGLPRDKKTASYGTLQKIIRKYWPNTTNIKNMRNRQEDVSRKVMLLLYIITEGITEDDPEASFYDEDLMPEEELTADERFEEHYVKVNLLLMECGFSSIDPRNVFDWLIIYSLKAEEEDFMQDRFQAVIDKIFDKEGKEFHEKDEHFDTIHR